MSEYAEMSSWFVKGILSHFPVSVYTAQQLESICTFLMENNIPYKIKCAPHPCRWLLTLRRIPARGSVLHVAFGRVSPGTNRAHGSFCLLQAWKKTKEC